MSDYQIQDYMRHAEPDKSETLIKGISGFLILAAIVILVFMALVIGS